MCENINNYNLVSAINKLMLKDYDGMKEDLFEWAMFAQNTGSDFHKNIFKTFLGKILCDSKQARRALEIYNEQITYFADKKLASGALLCWYLIAEATVIAGSAKEAVDTAERALEIAQNPNINNLFFVAMLRILLAKIHIKLSDYESAKMNLEFALALGKKYGMNDLLSKIYLVYARYYQDLGSGASQNQLEYLRGAKAMYERALETVVNHTRSVYMKDTIEENKKVFDDYCEANGISI
jgi:tetratricopeptide (TPR) repeat protein